MILQDLRAGVLAAGRHHNSSTQSTIPLHTSFQLLGEGRQALCHHLEGQDQVGLVQAGYDYDAFKLFARMGGSPVRVKLLNILWQVLQGTASSLQMSLTLTGRP